MEMQIRSETPRAKKGWGMGSTMMTGGSKIRGVQLLITEFRDVEERNVQIMHKLSSVFMSMIKSDDDSRDDISPLYIMLFIKYIFIKPMDHRKQVRMAITL